MVGWLLNSVGYFTANRLYDVIVFFFFFFFFFCSSGFCCLLKLSPNELNWELARPYCLSFSSKSFVRVLCRLDISSVLYSSDLANSNLDGAISREHKQTSIMMMNFKKTFDKVQHWLP